MRQALRVKSPRGQTVQVTSYPAPVGGWNARDSLANMAPTDAVELKNWFPEATRCVLRDGQSDYATGITGTVETLAVYNPPSGSEKMFAIDSNDVWDVTSSGAATDSSAVGNPTVTNGRWQWVNFGDSSNNYLIMVNGVDAPIYWNGTAWVTITGVSSPALTGVTLTSLIHVNEYKGRLIFIEKNSMSFWYLPAGSAGGTLKEFDLTPYASEGGYLMWAATWSFDAGDGPDDAIAFMTSEGQIIIYRGTDPSTASEWVLTGVYHVGHPIGRRSFVNYGGDVVVITQDGAFPLSKALQSAAINSEDALTDKIQDAFAEATRDYGTNFGWDATLYAKESALVFNIPIKEGGRSKQYVMNTITGAWCEFDSWNAECFVEYNKDIYYGSLEAGAGVVRKAWSGNSDDGTNITAIGRTAFSYFGNMSQQKRFNFFRPMLRISGSLQFATSMDVDFSKEPITGTSTYTSEESTVWDTAVWDQDGWGGNDDIVRQWSSPVVNVGYCASGAIKFEVKGIKVQWMSSDFVYEKGGIL